MINLWQMQKIIKDQILEQELERAQVEVLLEKVIQNQTQDVNKK